MRQPSSPPPERESLRKRGQGFHGPKSGRLKSIALSNPPGGYDFVYMPHDRQKTLSVAVVVSHNATGSSVNLGACCAALRPRNRNVALAFVNFVDTVS